MVVGVLVIAGWGLKHRTEAVLLAARCRAGVWQQ